MIANKFSQVWVTNGIRWDDASNGTRWDANDHLRNSYQYNKDWENWISGNALFLNGQNSALAQQEAAAFAAQLGKKYGF
jgi:hypothetical protein